MVPLDRPDSVEDTREMPARARVGAEASRNIMQRGAHLGSPLPQLLSVSVRDFFPGYPILVPGLTMMVGFLGPEREKEFSLERRPAVVIRARVASAGAG